MPRHTKLAFCANCGGMHALTSAFLRIPKCPHEHEVCENCGVKNHLLRYCLDYHRIINFGSEQLDASGNLPCRAYSLDDIAFNSQPQETQHKNCDGVKRSIPGDAESQIAQHCKIPTKAASSASATATSNFTCHCGEGFMILHELDSHLQDCPIKAEASSSTLSTSPDIAQSDNATMLENSPKDTKQDSKEIQEQDEGVWEMELRHRKEECLLTDRHDKQRKNHYDNFYKKHAQRYLTVYTSYLRQIEAIHKEETREWEEIRKKFWQKEDELMRHHKEWGPLTESQIHEFTSRRQLFRIEVNNQYKFYQEKILKLLGGETMTLEEVLGAEIAKLKVEEDKEDLLNESEAKKTRSKEIDELHDRQGEEKRQKKELDESEVEEESESESEI